MPLSGKKRKLPDKGGASLGRGADEGKRPLPLGASATLLSRREVTVSGCRRITEYGSTKIRLSVREGEIAIEGRGLTVYTYRGDELTVRGWLSGIFFDDPVNDRNGRRQK